MKSLNRVELVLGGIILLIFLIWSFDKCGSSSKYQPQEPAIEASPTPAAESQPSQNSSATSAQPNTAPVAAPVVVESPKPAVSQSSPTIYVKIDGLKMRDKPGISGTKVVAQLGLNTPLSYLNEQTNFKEKITIGDMLYDEPWVKVRTTDGKLEGWVFGGGVRFYKD